ncbi:MAG: aspartate--tRNA ligase [Patescibacteria group bacterium]|nr:aspartate--tRNA ligase [Patescibacteria group bacterium]
MQRIFTNETLDQIDKKVKLAGFVNNVRKMGSIVFIDLRDKEGIIQVVLDKGFKEAKDLKPEYVIELEGKVAKRSEKNINPEIPTGEVEIQATSLKILSESKTPPFEIENEERQANEELRLKYRYLDLRHERMKNNIILRDKVIWFIRQWLHNKNFYEIETPLLTKGTPEGAREYIVPSRNFPGQFYVLPQSPQQFKQLLMISGFERYFQVARCFRDEDARGDRQAEFTQLDLEMAFTSDKKIMELTENLMTELVKSVCPKKKIAKKPFPILTYEEAMKKHQSDKPDLRENKKDKDNLAFCWVVNPPLFERAEKEKKLVSTHHPFTAPVEKDLKNLDKNPEKVKALSYDLVLNGYEIGTGSIRIHQKDLQQKIFEILGLSQKEIKKRFGHILEAFEYGVPPHGGMAPGLDRLVMLLAGEPNIREVMAFPKTSDARDLMMGAPSKLPESEVKEKHISIDKKHENI